MKMAQRWRSDWPGRGRQQRHRHPSEPRIGFRTHTVRSARAAVAISSSGHQAVQCGINLQHKQKTRLNPKQKKYNIKHACAQAPFTPTTATRGGVSRSRIICIFAMPPSSVRTKVLRQRAYKIISAGDDRKFGRARNRAEPIKIGEASERARARLDRNAG